MALFKVLLTTTQWHSKTIQADTKEQAQDIAFDGTLDLSDWHFDGLGEWENYNTIELKE